MAQSGSPPPFPTTEMSSEMRKKQKQEDEQGQLHAAASISEGPLLEILSRLPYRSLCRFKCVSKPWLALCSDPQVHKRCPQSLSGFFYRHTYGVDDLHFCNLSGRGPPMVDPSFPFLRKSYEVVNLRDCCGGLVLCRCWKSDLSDDDEFDLVVCNPATEKWIELPPCPIGSQNEAEQYLGFDPADPSRFVVFVHILEFTEVTIYTSDTGRWTTVQCGWGNVTFPLGDLGRVFLNGTMHLMTNEPSPSIVTVNTEGKVWRKIHIPGYSDDPSIGQSQGRLYAWYIGDPNVCQLSVWALEDYGSAKWTLKHTFNIVELFGKHCQGDDEIYKMLAIHPDRNLIFLTDGVEKTISYDMDNREVHVTFTCNEVWDVQPYIPCFAELLSDGH